MRTAFPQVFRRPGAGRSALALTLMGLAAFSLGRLVPPGGIVAQAQTPSTTPTPAPTATDDDKRVVAYIYNTIPITRQELGEYLIARYGAEKADLLVNKRIIEHVCAEQHVEVTAGEVDAALADDCKAISVDVAGFVKQVLAQYHKTLYEWKEDVIKPRLLLSKLCRKNVQVTEQDIKNEFESLYGESVDCRAIIYPNRELKNLMADEYEKLRTSDAYFDEAARKQPLPSLALTGGKIKPISHHSDNAEVERVAFNLKAGEVSEAIQTKQGLLILKCVQRIPAQTHHPKTSEAEPPKEITLEGEREALTKAIVEKKLQKEIPDYFQALRKEANPVVFLKPRETELDLVDKVKKNLKDTAPEAGNKLQGH
jgi:hypothetical protein